MMTKAKKLSGDSRVKQSRKIGKTLSLSISDVAIATWPTFLEFQRTTGHVDGSYTSWREHL